jgi:hypothetical protein
MRHLLEAGFTVFGYDVSAERLQSFRQAGGHVAELATEVVERSDVVLTELNRSPRSTACCSGGLWPVACSSVLPLCFCCGTRERGSIRRETTGSEKSAMSSIFSTLIDVNRG